MQDLPVFVIPLLIALFQAVEEFISAMELKGYWQHRATAKKADPVNNSRGLQPSLWTGGLLFLVLFGIRWLEEGIR
jgi:energy-coupling factor transport system ATP-binding protein